MPEELLDTLPPPPKLTPYERMKMDAEMDRVIKILARVHSGQADKVRLEYEQGLDAPEHDPVEQGLEK